MFKYSMRTYTDSHHCRFFDDDSFICYIMNWQTLESRFDCMVSLADHTHFYFS